MGTLAVTEPELPGRQVQRRPREHGAGPRARGARVERRRNAGIVEYRQLRARDERVLGRLGGIVAARNVRLDVRETAFVEMRAELLLAIFAGHVRHEPQVELRHGAAG